MIFTLPQREMMMKIEKFNNYLLPGKLTLFERSSNMNFVAENWKDGMFGSASSDEEADDIATGSEKDLKLPLFEIRSHGSAGGGRGVFATCDITAGTLILAEVPLLKWTLSENSLEDHDELLLTVKKVLSSEAAHAVTKNLHPRNLEDLRSEEISRIKALWNEDELHKIVADRPGVDIDELVRVALVLQHNGFSSGLYQLLCIVNHSCNPNCIKFSPLKPNGWQCASEIWATRDVRRGEELTICYCSSTSMTRHSRQEFLQNHHTFECRCERCENAVIVVDESAASNDGGADEDMEGPILGLEEKAATVLQEIASPTPHDRHATLLSAKENAKRSIRLLVEDVTPLLDICTDMLMTLLPYYEEEKQLRAEGESDCAEQSVCRWWTDTASLVTRLLKVATSLSAARANTLLAMFPLPTERGQISHHKLVEGAADFFLFACGLRITQESYLDPLHADLTQTLFDVTESISFLQKVILPEAPGDVDLSSFGNRFETLIGYFSSLVDVARSKSACIQYSAQAKKKYSMLESMYKSTYPQLTDNLKTSSIVTTSQVLCPR